VSRILTRLRLNQLRMLEPAVPIVRYEHPAPGDLLHIDIKKLARIHKPGHRMTGNPQDETRRAVKSRAKSLLSSMFCRECFVGNCSQPGTLFAHINDFRPY
jgi:hypothetical protein